MTLQEFFDETVKYAMQMTHPCKNDMDMCFYRHPDPFDSTCDRCWIGKRIPDDKYNPKMEHRRVYDADINEAAGVPRELVYAACQLQSIHDREPKSKWRASLVEFANNNELVIPPELT